MRDWRHGWPVAAVCALVLAFVGWQFLELVRDPEAATATALQETFGRTAPSPTPSPKPRKPKRKSAPEETSARIGEPAVLAMRPERVQR